MPPEHAAADARALLPATPRAALWRLRSYLRPYLWRLIGMLAAACASVATALVIPLLTKDLIDSAISTGDRSLVVPIGLAATGLGIAQAALNFTRRWVQASVVGTNNDVLLNLPDTPLDRLYASVLTSLIGEGAREVAVSRTRGQADEVIDAVIEYAARLMADGPWKPDPAPQTSQEPRETGG